MALTHGEVARVVDELGWVLPGGVVEGFSQHAPRRFVLSVRQSASEGQPEYGHNVLICLQPPHVRLHLTHQRLRKKRQRLSLGEYVRSRIEGARVVEVVQLNADRIVEFALDKAGERLSLVVELFPRGPHIELVDAERKIVASLDARRVGTTHELPPKPELVRDDEPVEAPEGTLYNTVLDERYAEVDAAELFESDKRQLVSQLRRERRRLRRLVERLERDVDAGRQWDEFGRYGELLKTALSTRGAGRTELGVQDFSSGETVTVPLDPKLGVRDNMEAYFKRSRKLRRTLEKAEREIGGARTRLAEVEEACEAAEKVESADELEGFLDERGLALKPKQVPKARPRAGVKGKPAEEFRYFVSAAGKKIYVGRSEAENDRLTISFARGHDLWLHCHDYAGSHVVVPLRRNEEADRETLLDAATLALAYSKAKRAGSGEVLYTQRRYVSKPKRMPPGKVYVSTHKTMHVKLDEARLRKIKERTKEG